jgi:hypothetical protein
MALKQNKTKKSENNLVSSSENISSQSGTLLKLTGKLRFKRFSDLKKSKIIVSITSISTY